MRNTSKKAAKKRTPKHPQKTRPVKPESYIQTVSRMLTVRRMFSLLHYRVILARKGANVKDFFLPFSEYSAPGLGIVDSGQLGCRFAKNWEFARRAGGQVVRKICVVVFALRRSVSFYFVGDGLPVPPHTHLRIPGDGKPVPYEWMTINSPKFGGDSHTRKESWFSSDTF